MRIPKQPTKRYKNCRESKKLSRQFVSMAKYLYRPHVCVFCATNEIVDAPVHDKDHFIPLQTLWLRCRGVFPHRSLRECTLSPCMYSGRLTPMHALWRSQTDGMTTTPADVLTRFYAQSERWIPHVAVYRSPLW